MSAEHTLGTVAQLRIDDWTGRGLRGEDCWQLAGHPVWRAVFDDNVPDVIELVVLNVELPGKAQPATEAPMPEPRSFGTRVEHGSEDWREEVVLVDVDNDGYRWFSADGDCHNWSELINPVVLHDPEASEPRSEQAVRDAERNDWSSWLDGWTGSVGPRPPTVEDVATALRSGPRPFGSTATSGADR